MAAMLQCPLPTSNFAACITVAFGQPPSATCCAVLSAFAAASCFCDQALVDAAKAQAVYSQGCQGNPADIHAPGDAYCAALGGFSRSMQAKCNRRECAAMLARR
eukprot:SM000122S25808  [mRNA]  locus=s122:331621:332193:+ [translate_table: standard]